MTRRIKRLLIANSKFYGRKVIKQKRLLRTPMIATRAS